MEIVTANQKEWDEYLTTNTKSCFFHQWGWRTVLEQTFHYQPVYIVAKEKGKVCGILPLFFVKDYLRGHKLVSLPFCTEAGLLSDNAEAEQALLTRMIAIADEMGVDYAELRQKDHLLCLPPHFAQDKRYYTLILSLHPDPDIIWHKLNKKARNATRKAVQAGLKVEIQPAHVFVKQFYKVYAVNMRDLGTPVDGFRLFDTITQIFKNTVKIAAVFQNDKCIGGIMLFEYHNTIVSEWASSLRQYFSLCPNNIAYWEAIKYACGTGFKYFDFGRSLLGEGTFNFKKHYGAEPLNLNYAFYLRKGAMPDISKTNRKRILFAKIWKQLPLPLTNRLGPSLRRRFP